MREISAGEIEETVAQLCQQANYYLPDDVIAGLKDARQREEAPRAKKVFDIILENAEIAARDKVALCQDTGTAIVFLEVGQDVHIQGDLHQAILGGVSRGYKTGFLRSSMVRQPYAHHCTPGGGQPPMPQRALQERRTLEESEHG